MSLLTAPQSDIAVMPNSTYGVWPFISVIVPVRNESAYISRTLTQLITQNYPNDRYEIIVADGRSTDETRHIVQQFVEKKQFIKLLDNPKLWSSAGRNVAIQSSKGEIILLIDGHCEICNDNYLRDLAEAFEVSGADSIGRPQPLSVEGASPFQHVVALARSCWLGHHPSSYIYSKIQAFVPAQSVAIAYRRYVFEKIGLFDESFDACEDYEFNHRLEQAGLTCYFTPKVIVYYHPRNSIVTLFRQMVRYGRGRVRLLRKFPETFSLAALCPAAFLSGLVVGPIVSFIQPQLWYVYFAVIAVYIVTLTLVSFLQCHRGRCMNMIGHFISVFFTIHTGAAIGVWLELLTGFSGKKESK